MPFGDQMTTFRIIGVYRITPTRESLAQAAHFYRFEWLLDAAGQYADEVNEQDFQNLSLIEIQMNGGFTQEWCDSIWQGDGPDNCQAPYLEYFVDPSGSRLLSSEEAVRSEGRRVCFFLHFTDVQQPLLIDGKPMRLPAFSELPKRLDAFTHYVPVD